MSFTARFEGRTVLITGGAKGIGFAVAKKFLAAGASVIVIDQDEHQLQEVAKTYPTIKTVCLDISDWEKTKEVIKGLGVIHHLVNNAGVAQPAEDFLDIKSDSIDRIFGINFKALVNVSQVVASKIIEAKVENATIVNISSISDTVAVPGLALYSSSKAAVTMFTKSAALELAEFGIRVNCVRPAMVRTEQVGRLTGNCSKVLEHAVKLNERRVIDRMIEMDEVADAVLFLSSNASSIITGSDILLDGGILIR